jgi:solute carrier family 35 protein F1/2
MSVVQTEPPHTLTYIGGVYDEKPKSTSPPEELVPPLLTNDHQFIARPAIDYSSVGAFCHSSWRRFLSLWTRRFVLCFVGGQVLSLCITCTNVTTEELAIGNWQLPTTQTIFL